jgi:hypothetical protein
MYRPYAIGSTLMFLPSLLRWDYRRGIITEVRARFGLRGEAMQHEGREIAYTYVFL